MWATGGIPQEPLATQWYVAVYIAFAALHIDVVDIWQYRCKAQILPLSFDQDPA